MPSGTRWCYRLSVLALLCWGAALPLTTFVQSSVVCRDRTMHERMHHGSPSEAPCWCSSMTGGAIPIGAEAPSLPAGTIVLAAWPLPRRTFPMPPPASLPLSPSYAPTPPPPNAVPV